MEQYFIFLDFLPFIIFEVLLFTMFDVGRIHSQMWKFYSSCLQNTPILPRKEQMTNTIYERLCSVLRGNKSCWKTTLSRGWEKSRVQDTKWDENKVAIWNRMVSGTVLEKGHSKSMEMHSTQKVGKCIPHILYSWDTWDTDVPAQQEELAVQCGQIAWLGIWTNGEIHAQVGTTETVRGWSMFLEETHGEFPINWMLEMKTGLKDESKFSFGVSERITII